MNKQKAKRYKISKLGKRFLLVQHEQTNIIEIDETHDFALIALSTANKLKYDVNSENITEIKCLQRVYKESKWK